MKKSKKKKTFITCEKLHKVLILVSMLIQSHLVTSNLPVAASTLRWPHCTVLSETV